MTTRSYVQEVEDTIRAMKRAEQFAKDNIVQIAKELIDWQNGRLVPENGKLRELSLICKGFYAQPMAMAENIAKSVAIHLIAERE